MDLTVSGVALVPYAADDWSLDDIRLCGLLRESVSITSRVPCAVVEVAGRGWRLNSARMEAQPAQVGEDVFAALRGEVEAGTGPWDQAGKRLIASYFDWVERIVEADRIEIEEKLAPYQGLFSYRDFRFSAPRPLPRAHLLAPADPGKPAGREDFIRVDMAFFPGRGRIVALTSSRELTPRKNAERRARLTGAGIELHALETAGSDDALFAAIVGAEPFWTGDALPCSPLRPAVLA
ncbi:hypothetical protein ACFQU1_14115 [Chelatococcus sp. GCM10030263]|uniref:hypothetical protein n=1 Tax=Chelatococcus sp. GCM10030263 TaxID=3273387 RepID=UPI003619AEB1